ncbi:uncharacterized protein LOC131694907, partial [Topomyia yanbarensis]|uniref:uncharacterized protein LOC131694907 n=1 Tax=Topomyia yanbarensis TaxID=2498891 RepID=UPI00273CD713
MQRTLPSTLSLSRNTLVGLARDLAKSGDNLVVVKRLRIFKILSVSGVSSVMLPTDRLTILLTMACLSSSNRVCARVVQEKLCQFVVGKNQLVATTTTTSTAAGNSGSGSGTGAGSGNGSKGGGSVSVVNSVAKRTPVFSGAVYPLFTSGVGAIGVEAFKYGPCGIGVGSVRNFYSSSLVRNLFKKNQ